MTDTVLCTTCLNELPITDFYIEPRKEKPTTYKKATYNGIPDTHRPTAVCKRCKARAGRYSSYSYQARRRGYSFNLTKELFYFLLEQDCYYCGSPATEEAIGYNGLDRMDNSIGYEVGNVITSCGACNTMKMNINKEPFLNRIGRIHNRHNVINVGKRGLSGIIKRYTDIQRPIRISIVKE